MREICFRGFHPSEDGTQEIVSVWRNGEEYKFIFKTLAEAINALKYYVIKNLMPKGEED